MAKKKSNVQYTSAGKRVPAIFSQTAIAAGDTENIVVQPQIDFRPETVVVSPSIADHFSIANLKVGNDPQIAVGEGSLPCDMFPPTQLGAVDYEMDLCNAGTQMTLSVTNNDTTAHDFVAGIWGHEMMEVDN